MTEQRMDDRYGWGLTLWMFAYVSKRLAMVVVCYLVFVVAVWSANLVLSASMTWLG